jgi:hypothetical protein
MRTQKFPFKWLTSWLAWSLAALLIAAVIFIWLSHRTQVIEAHSTLQNGMKMNVRLTSQLPWGWVLPNRLIAMDVSINGKNVPVAMEAYYGLQPLDLSRRVIIAETGGFPEIVAWGASKSSLADVHWRFLNYSFSELDVFRNHREDISYYSSPPLPLGQIRVAQYDASVPVIIIGKDSIKKISTKDLTK